MSDTAPTPDTDPAPKPDNGEPGIVGQIIITKYSNGRTRVDGLDGLTTDAIYAMLEGAREIVLINRAMQVMAQMQPESPIVIPTPRVDPKKLKL